MSTLPLGFRLVSVSSLDKCQMRRATFIGFEMTMRCYRPKQKLPAHRSSHRLSCCQSFWLTQLKSKQWTYI